MALNWHTMSHAQHTAVVSAKLCNTVYLIPNYQGYLIQL